MTYAAAQQVAEHYHLTYMEGNVVRSDASGMYYFIDVRTHHGLADDYAATPAVHVGGVGWMTLEGATGYTGRYDDAGVIAEDPDTLAERIYAAR